MATEAMKQLIDICYENDEMREAIRDIIKFTWRTIERITKPETQDLAAEGFPFFKEGITTRRQELRAFLTTHPECMSEDIETTIDKIGYFLEKDQERMLKEKQRTQKRIHEKSQARLMKRSTKKPAPPKKEKEEKEKEEPKEEQEEESSEETK